MEKFESLQPQDLRPELLIEQQVVTLNSELYKLAEDAFGSIMSSDLVNDASFVIETATDQCFFKLSVETCGNPITDVGEPVKYWFSYGVSEPYEPDENYELIAWHTVYFCVANNEVAFSTSSELYCEHSGASVILDTSKRLASEKTLTRSETARFSNISRFQADTLCFDEYLECLYAIRQMRSLSQENPL